MKTKLLWVMAVLNALLLAWYVGADRFATEPAHAQVARPGEYIMVPGEVIGGQSAVIYIIDQTNRQLSARVYDSNTKRMVDMAPIPLDRVFSGK